MADRRGRGLRADRLAPGSAFPPIVVLLLAAGCTRAGVAGPIPEPAASPHPLSTRSLLPLEHDTVFSYETVNDAGEAGLMVLQIRRPRPGLAELDVAGRVQRLDIGESSVLHASGGYLLKDPIAVGATFPGAFGQVRIVQTTRAVAVPAGNFAGCVVTVEESTQPFKRAQSTYCPDVGLVSLVVEASGDADVLRVESRLKSYGPRVDLR